MEGFLLTIEELRRRRGIKWHRYDDDVLPAWVADMDFTVAEPVQRAVERLVEAGDYGYAHREGDEGVEAAFRDRMSERFGWAPPPERTIAVADLVQGVVATISAFTRPAEGVVVQTPIYPPFLGSIDGTGRRQVAASLVDDGARFVVDEDVLRQAIDPEARVMLLCNPHNPTGRALAREELEAIGRVALERDLVIVADEIHCDLVYPGSQHLPMALIGAEVAARTVTLNSATKGFNIPNLRCGVMHFGSDELLERFRAAVPERLLGAPSIPGVDATVAAWREGQPWLDTVMPLLLANRDRVAEWVATELPEIHHHAPEATYLAWLDCRGLGLPGGAHEFFLERARVGLGAGPDFGPGGHECVRLNFATSPEILDEILCRMGAAVGNQDRRP